MRNGEDKTDQTDSFDLAIISDGAESFLAQTGTEAARGNNERSEGGDSED